MFFSPSFVTGKSHCVCGAQYAGGIWDNAGQHNTMGRLAGLPKYIEDVSKHIYLLESLLHDTQSNLKTQVDFKPLNTPFV